MIRIILGKIYPATFFRTDLQGFHPEYFPSNEGEPDSRL
jgi:hypothetical protein